MTSVSRLVPLLLLGFALAGCGQPEEPQKRKPPTQPPMQKAPPGLPQVGQVAPEFEGEDLDGKKFKLSAYRGQVVLLDFWSTD